MTRNVIVTGASRGIGASIAELLAADGYRVCVNYREDEAAAARVVAAIETAGGEAFAVRADVATEAGVDALFAAADERFGRLDALVNNAGIIGPRCRIDELSSADLQRVVAVNVIGLVLCTQAAIRRMSTRHGGAGGAIVNISSGSAYIGGAGENVHYALSKGAVNSFTIGGSQEVAGEGVRINSVSPGLTRTDMVTEQAIESVATRVPMGRIGEPEEIARAVRWLLSDEAGFVAGANIRVAGGRP